LLKKDYVKDEVINRLEIQSYDEISKTLEVDKGIVSSFAYIVNNGVKFGDIMTSDLMEQLYIEGLTYNEIAYLKGITKTGVRLSISRMVGNRLASLKEKHKESRSRIYANIQTSRIRQAMKESRQGNAAVKLGYKDSYYDVLQRKYVGRRI